MFSLEPRVVGWILLSCAGISGLLYAAWHFETIWAFLKGEDSGFGSAQSEKFRPRYANFLIGPSDQRSVEVGLGEKDIVIRVDHDIRSLSDPDFEMACLVDLVKDVWGHGFGASGYMDKKAKNASEVAMTIASLNAEVQRFKKKSEDYYISFQKHEQLKSRYADLEKERAVAEAKIAEHSKWIEKAKAEIDATSKIIDATERTAVSELKKRTAQKRFVDHMKAALRQANLSLEQTRGELATIRMERDDLLDERLNQAQLMVDMGQRILKQAELLSKRAEHKPKVEDHPF